jgi:hypothetical protein
MNAQSFVDRPARPEADNADKTQRRARLRALLVTGFYTLCFFAAVETAHLLLDDRASVTPIATSR